MKKRHYIIATKLYTNNELIFISFLINQNNAQVHTFRYQHMFLTVMKYNAILHNLHT